MQDCRVGERFHGGHADEGGEIEIRDVDFISMSIEISADEYKSVVIDRLDVFQRTHAGDLLGEDAVQLGIDAVTVDGHGDEFAAPPPRWGARPR